MSCIVVLLSRLIYRAMVPAADIHPLAGNSERRKNLAELTAQAGQSPAGQMPGRSLR